MKTNKWIFVIMIASLSCAACDNDDDNENKPSLNDTDENFIEKVAMSNKAEIAFGEIAVSKGTDSLVTSFGQQMVSEHTTAQTELNGIADDYNGIDWPGDLDQQNKDLLELLNTLNGYAFDSLYIKSRVTAHELALTNFETVIASGTELKVKTYANKYLPRIESNLQEADSIETVIQANATSD